jgi:muramoyltetrapeptide carboxypeptidase
MQPFPPIPAGSRVALVAPAGPLRLPADLDKAIANSKTLEWLPAVGRNAEKRLNYFAGSDEARISDVNAAIRDDSISAIWCLRGGYGAMRLLDHIDWEALRRKPKAIIGFSDITALHCAAMVKAGVSTIHGPTARGKIPPFSEKSLRAAITRSGNPAGDSPGSRTLHKGRARGHIVAGNLAILLALHGTPYQPNYDGAILVVEDVNEAPYRIERLLLTLKLSGQLQRCAGIAFGSFTNTGEEDKSLGGSRPMSDVLLEAAEWAGVPAIMGVPVGHIDNQWSLPVGATAELDADKKSLTVIWT